MGDGRWEMDGGGFWLGLRMLVSMVCQVCCWQVLQPLPTAIAVSETCGGQLMVRLSAVSAASRIPVGWLVLGGRG
jgi:hypothetical protein